MSVIVHGVIVLLAAWHPQMALGQAANPGFDPLQPEKHFDAARSEQNRSGPHPSVPTSRGGASATGDTKKLFVLRGVSVSGADAIAPAALTPAYQPYLGRRVSQADLGAIAESITQQYRQSGYHLSRAIVPPQDIKGGRITIKVIEGRIADLVISGDAGDRFGVRAMMAPVLATGLSRQDLLERQLLLINATPGIRVADTALEEIGTASGRFRLTVYVKTWNVYTAFSLDNFGSSAVGPWQSYATGAFNSYLTPGDSMVVNLSTTPGDPRQLAFGRIGYETPIGIDGVRIGGSALYSEVRPGDWRRTYGDLTKTESYEIHGSVVPVQSLNQILTLTLGATVSNISESDIFGTLYNDHLRILSGTMDYRLKDDFGGVNYLTLGWRQGLDVMGASKRGDDFISRDSGTGAFSAINLSFTRYQSLTDAWSLKVSAAGQYASTQLLTSQQYYLGGGAFGRGYGNAEISGDNAMAGALELRYDGTLSLPYTRGYQLYGFAETGAVWNVGYNYTDGLSLSSVGAGIRLFFDGDLRADIGVGVPLSYRSPDNSSRSARFLFTLSNAFRLCPERARFTCT